MASKKNVSNKVTQVFNQAKTQAKESLKLLEAFEKETLKKAKTFVKIPIPTDRTKLTNDKILASLKKLGVATQAEVNELKARIEALEAQLATKSTRASGINAGSSASTSPNS